MSPRVGRNLICMMRDLVFCYAMLGDFLGGWDDVLMMSYSRLMTRLRQFFTMIVLEFN